MRLPGRAALRERPRTCLPDDGRLGRRTRVGLSFIPPGEPWRNGYVESFNARVRDECLNINIFSSLTQARVVIGDWKDDYNHRRRHSSLGYRAPASYAGGQYAPIAVRHRRGAHFDRPDGRAGLIRIERWRQRSHSVVIDHIEDGDELDQILAEAVDMLDGSHDGHPTVTLCRPDGSTLSLSTDGRRALAVWINSLEESAHSIGGQPGPDLVFDYGGSYSEAPHEWTVPIADAVECARRFIQIGAPDTEEVLFEQD